MTRNDYGYSGLNANLNSQLTSTPNLDRGDNSSARVISIVLDENHPRFIELGGWTALGAIEYDLTSNPKENLGQYPVAYPLDPNIKKYPLINEVVSIQSGFSSAVNLFEENINITSGRSRKYYTTGINVWNHPHHNGYSFNISGVPPTQNKSYNQIEAGDTSNISDTPVELNLGNTFKEKSNVHPLLPFEGDIIYEGRWGNSIRLGSTVKNTPNFWSSIGNNGDPIIVINNGQGPQDNDGAIPIVENINNNESSIYLTSTQNIPLNVARKDYTSYSGSYFSPPTSPNEYNGSQILLNSGRLVFNSYLDHILLSSAKSINLNSFESTNIDTRKFIVRADNIYLGPQYLANQPLMLGNKTVNLLKNLVDSLILLTDELKKLTSDPVAPNTPATFTNLNIKAIGTSTILNQIKQDLNTPNYLTSKQNYTL